MWDFLASAAAALAAQFCAIFNGTSNSGVVIKGNRLIIILSKILRSSSNYESVARRKYEFYAKARLAITLIKLARYVALPCKSDIRPSAETVTPSTAAADQSTDKAASRSAWR